MSTISRRRVAVGAAWALPVIVVGGAAPAMAASVCTPFTVTSAIATKGGVQLILQKNAGYSGCITTFQVLPGSARLLDWDRLPCLDEDPLRLNGVGRNSGNDYRGTYIVSYVVTTPTGPCAGTLTFVATGPAPTP